MKERKSALAEKTKFVTFALDSVKLCTVHRKEKGERNGKTNNGKTPRDLGPADTTIHAREEGPTGQLWQGGGLMVNILWDRSTEDELAKFKKTVLMVEKKDFLSCLPRTQSGS